MTYCLGIKVQGGIVAVADTRISTSNAEVYNNKKVSTHIINDCPLFIMTSGLRSVRDKTIIYFKQYIEEVAEEEGFKIDHMFQAASKLGDMIRKVSSEDKVALKAEGYAFNVNAIIGGQMAKDEEHKLFLVFPEGNWIEINEGLKFQIVGNPNYGKPLIYRNLRYESSMKDALKLGLLSFDATQVSASDVGYPLDVIWYEKNSFKMIEHRLQQEDVAQVSSQWSALLTQAIAATDDSWMKPVLDKV